MTTIDPTDIFCLPLDQPVSLDQTGGKAANLARVSSLGLAIPNSFVITTAAVNYFLKDTGLHERITRYLAELTSQRRDRQNAAYEVLCQEVMAADIPHGLREEIASHAQPLLSGAPHGLAVRSSACCEDLDHASFAGIFKSFLCIRSEHDLSDRIKQCWCSCWKPQAIAYADRMGLTLAPHSMAVLVQETLYPDRSGVIFTADPLTGNPWRFSVNATFGFLQAAVDGQAVADCYQVEWNTGKTVDQSIATKTTSLRPGDAGLETERIDSSRAAQSSLEEKTLQLLWSTAAVIEQAFNKPMDIEWVMQSDLLTIVQARPITALPQFFPHTLAKQDAQFTWSLSSPYWYVPAEVGGALVAPLFRHIWDAEMWRRPVPDGLDLLSRACREQDFNGYRYTTDGWSGVSGNWLDILVERGEEQELQRICESTEQRLDEIEVELRTDWEQGKQRILDASRHSRERILATETARELISPLLQQIEFDPRGNYMGYGAPQSLGTLCERMLKRFLQQQLAGFPVERLVMGLPSYSYVRLAAAQHIGRLISEKPVREALQTMPLEDVIPFLMDHAVGDVFLQQFEEFCWNYGQCPPSWRNRPPMWTTGTPAWADFSTELLVTIKKAMQGNSRDIELVQSTNRKIRQEAAEQARQQLPASLLHRFNKLLDWASFWFPILDDRLWMGGRQHLTRYELLWQVATRLTAEGVIDHAEEIFMLGRDDLLHYEEDAAFDLRSAFLTNRAEYAKNKRLSPPPWIGKSPAASTALPTRDTNSPRNTSPVTTYIELPGTGRSPGTIQGRARVASGLSAAFLDKLTDQDILVCLEEIPFRVDWLAIFLVARGLVAATNCGAGLHHALQIARECGVVYVELPDERVEQIADNALIELDGSTGLVTILGLL